MDAVYYINHLKVGIIMKYFKNEEAVSPVIGVILMVAITVILAAVIGVFVFGLAGGIQSTKTVALVATANSTGGLEVVVHGGPDLNKLSDIGITVDGADAGAKGTPSVGQVLYADADGSDIIGKRVIVVGNFTDGSSAILIDKTF